MRFALLPAFIALASASPVVKRQSVVSSAVETVSSVVESVVTSAVPVPTAVSSAVSSVASAASSAVSSVSSAAASASASAVPEYAILYPCPAGSDLTYVEEQMSFPGTLEAVTPLVAFESSTWYGVQANDTANSPAQVGDMRTVMFPGIPTPIMEVLVNQSVAGLNVPVQQVFNGTAPLTVGNITLAAYSTVLQLYTNDTTPTDVTAKIFTNACVAPVAEVNAALTQIFQAALAALAAEAATPPAASGSMSMSMSMPAVPSMASSMMPSMSMSMPSAPAASSVVAPIISSAAAAGSSIVQALPSVSA